MATTYFVSGANRGIGLGLVKALLQLNDTVVFAGVRDPSRKSELDTLADTYPGRLIIAKVDAANVDDAKALNTLILEKTGHLDVLIANAGISEYYAPLATSDLDQFKRHYEVNLLGPVVLYQQLRQALHKSKQPKYIAISTLAASLGTPFPIGASPYVVSKAGLNSVVQTINLEEPTFVAIALSPGWVQTEMGTFGAKAHNLEEAPVKLQDSVDGIMKVVLESKRDTHNGIFWDYTGEKLAW